MRNKQEKPQRYTMDGFVPRTRGDQPRPRSTIDGMTRRSRVAPTPRAENPHDAREAFAFNDEVAVTGSLSHPVDLEVDPEELQKPKWWQFKKKREYKEAKHRQKQLESERRKKLIKRIALGFGALLLILGLFLGWKFFQNAAKVFDGNVLGFFDNTKLRGEEEGRVNILLAGTSEDDGPEHGGATLTDSIMLISIDTRNNSGFTVSIPRDLWVEYGERCAAGYEGKINNAYQCGEDIKFRENGYADGGMGLLQKVVSTNLGLPVHYYGKISYDAFQEAVDAVGGIEITIQSEDSRGIYDPNIQPQDGGPLRLQNGLRKLDGKTALALARSRNSNGGYGMSRGDFDRTTYQRAMLLALKDKALSTGVVANPARIGELLDTAGNNVKTDFKTNELRRLYNLSKLVKNQDVTSIDLASEEVNLLTTGMYGDQSIVRPVAGLKDFSQIKLFFRRLTSNDPMVREAPTAAVLNGSGVGGLAQTQADALNEKGIATDIIANASRTYEKTVVIDLTKGQKPASKKALESQFGVAATTNTGNHPDALNYDVDFVIILGKNTKTTP